MGSLGAEVLNPDLEEADRVMLEFVTRLTRTPRETGARDVERLRDEGFDDRAIHDICGIAAYYAFVNRIADGLGVDLEERFPASSADRE